VWPRAFLTDGNSVNSSCTDDSELSGDKEKSTEFVLGLLVEPKISVLRKWE
jgi:hypothetical protein